ncbi:hypothetical protein EC973_006168, partial [Apophysomyces ossiformis]
RILETIDEEGNDHEEDYDEKLTKRVQEEITRLHSIRDLAQRTIVKTQEQQKKAINNKILSKKRQISDDEYSANSDNHTETSTISVTEHSIPAESASSEDEYFYNANNSMTIDARSESEVDHMEEIQQPTVDHIRITLEEFNQLAESYQDPLERAKLVFGSMDQRSTRLISLDFESYKTWMVDDLQIHYDINLIFSVGTSILLLFECGRLETVEKRMSTIEWNCFYDQVLYPACKDSLPLEVVARIPIDSKAICLGVAGAVTPLHIFGKYVLRYTRNVIVKL